MRPRIIVFAKAPVPGKAKTRLIPALGEEGAAKLACQMLLDTWREASEVDLAEAELCTEPEPGHADWNGLLPEGARVSAQGQGDLGDRLARAAERVICGGNSAVFIGTDCPGLDRARLREACRLLESHEAVIHPALDGGYALLGLSRFDSSVFSGIEWSTDRVARGTVARIEALDWTLHIGETLRDIDEPADLAAAGMN